MGRAEVAVCAPPPKRPNRSEANEKKELNDLRMKYSSKMQELAQINKEKVRLQNLNKAYSNNLKIKTAALKSTEAECAAAKAANERLARLQAKFASRTAAPVSVAVPVPINPINIAESVVSSLLNKGMDQSQARLEYHRANDQELQRAAQSERNERHVRSEAIKDNDQSRRRDNITMAVTLAKGDPTMTALLLEHLEPPAPPH